MGRRRQITLDLGEERPKKKSWKGKLTLWIILLVGGYFIGFFHDLNAFKETFLDKKQIKDKVDEKTLILEQKIDSIKELNLELDKELNAQLAKIDSLSASECAIFLQNRYK